jgi:hypothetical protein
MVHGWSVHLYEQRDPVLKWKTTATCGSEFVSAEGMDAENCLVNLAGKLAINGHEMLGAFGL